MKLHELSRITKRSAEFNGPVTVKKPYPSITRPKLLELIEADPGKTAVQYARMLHSESDTGFEARVGNTLAQMAKSDKWPVTRLKQDGRYRHYPKLKDLTNDAREMISEHPLLTKKPTFIEYDMDKPILTPPVRDEKAEWLERIVKDFCWDTEVDVEPYKDLLEWYKENNK